MSKKQHCEFLHPLRLYTPICMNYIINIKVSSGEVANASAILGLLYELSSQKDLCHLLLVLESTFPGTQGTEQFQKQFYHDHGDAETVTDPQQELRKVVQRLLALWTGSSESILLGHGVTL